VSIYNVKNFPGASPGPPFKGEGREREGEGREGKKLRRGEGWEGSIRQIKFYDYSTPLPFSEKGCLNFTVHDVVSPCCNVPNFHFLFKILLGVCFTSET
jgi:hypothetical protein